MNTLEIVLAVAFALVGVGLYGLLITRNLIKVVIALQVMIKGVLLALVMAGLASEQPALGQSVVQTPADGLVAGDITVRGPDGAEVPAYRAQPAGAGPFRRRLGDRRHAAGWVRRGDGSEWPVASCGA